MRPTLKSLSINFTFGTTYKINKDVLSKYQQAFEGLEKVSFVGSTSNFMYGNVAVCMLKKAHLSSLQFTICGNEYFGTVYSDDIEWDKCVLERLPAFKIFSLTNMCYDALLELPLIKLLNFGNYEILIFQKYNYTLVHATPLLKQFICKNFDVEVNNLSDLGSVVVGQVAIMLWLREMTQFDHKFYSNLLTILKEYLTFRFDSSHHAPVSEKYNWYCVEQSCPPDDSNHSHDEGFKFKKARLAQQSLILNYDDTFREKERNINLEIKFKDPLNRPINIHSCDLFKKLTHLSLVGNVQYTSDFFKNLFEKCDTLVTLVIIKSKGNFHVPTLLNCLPKSKILKNLLINVNMLHYFPLFTYLSECKSIENIHLVTSNTHDNTLPNPSDLFIKCENLYSICIRCTMPHRAKMLKFYKKVRSKLGKNYLYLDIIPFTDEDRRSLYSPYFNVFNVYQLKPM
ncbi:uncharacterized protein LOC128679007 isoform X2 [Plodia interpunctella]|nr:uncharacterized protein LOC128679007 isoform X2 [Plodia interpunctella]